MKSLNSLTSQQNAANRADARRRKMPKQPTTASMERAASHATNASTRKAASGQQQSSGRKGKTKPISAVATHRSGVTEKHSMEIAPSTLSQLRRLPNGDMADLVLDALKWGVRHRITKKGIMLYGENGETATVHFSASDQRAVNNTRRYLRALGFEPGRK